MSRKKRGGNKVRDATSGSAPKPGMLGLFLSSDSGGDLCIPGYIPLSKNPEVISAVNKIAALIGSMTIHLMANSDEGDVRIKNELSRQVDITPNRYMTRMTLVSWIIRTMMLEGGGNAVVWPNTERGHLGDLEPIPAGRVGFRPSSDGFGYAVTVDGSPHDPGDLLHFVLNPDENFPWKGCGIRVALQDVVSNLAQAARTKKGFMASKWKPALVVRVESNAEELSNDAGRAKFAEQYLGNSQEGQPWIIPAELMEVQQVKPLSLTDLAVNEAVTLDKKTVAAILGVPPYVVGAGEFHRDEWNAFVTNTIKPIVTGMEQELTRKLLVSESMFFRMNPWSLYAYDISALANIGSSLYVRGIMTGNEVRDWIGQGPLPGLDSLVILENYIPLDKIGDQLKLNQGEGGSENE